VSSDVYPNRIGPERERVRKDRSEVTGKEGVPGTLVLGEVKRKSGKDRL